MFDIYLLFVFILGAVIGSFVNVIVHRMPQHILQSDVSRSWYLAYPGSTTPCCERPIAWFHNIPIFSWLFLKGRCDYCQQPIKIRYLMVEVVLALVFVVIFQIVGMQWVTLFYFGFAVLTISLFWIDLENFLLPDQLTYSLLWLGLFASTLSLTPINSQEAIWSAVLAYLLMWSINQLYWLWRKKDGFGGGDLKLLAALSAWTGLMGIPLVLGLASLFGLLTTFFVSLFYRKNLQLSTSIPFGPFLILGGVVVLLFR